MKKTSPEIENSIVAQASDNPGITLENLIIAVGLQHTDDIYRLITRGVIYVDLYAAALAEPETVFVFKNKLLAEAYSLSVSESLCTQETTGTLIWEQGAYVLLDGKPFRISLIGETKTYLESPEKELIDLDHQKVELLVKRGDLKGVKVQDNNTDDTLKKKLRSASDKDIAMAIRDIKIVRAYINGDDTTELFEGKPKSLRTVQRWVHKYREALSLNNDPVIEMLPEKKGPKVRKMSEDELKFMHGIIEKEYENDIQIDKQTVYGVYVIKCEELGQSPRCYKILSAEIDKRPAYEKTKKRQGHKAAYKHQIYYWRLKRSTPRHGDRPFEICHLDHTQIDLELLSEVGDNFGRPWLTFLIDAYSRRILAFYLAYHRPNTISCIMTLRYCVQKFCRLPRTIVVDGGKEFGSAHFERFLGRHDCMPESRPKEESNFGSVGERIFGTTKTGFFNKLNGNTQNTKNVRELTKATDPKRLAVWVLRNTVQNLIEFIDLYETKRHPALGQSPLDAFSHGMIWSGQRPSRLTLYDEEFIMDTLPPTRKGTSKIIPGRGFRMYDNYYWNEAFMLPGIEGSEPPTKREPLNIGIGYARINNKWIMCKSEHFDAFQGKSEREIQITSEVIRKLKQAVKGDFKDNAKRLAAFYLAKKDQGFKQIQEQQMKDDEQRKILKSFETNPGNNGKRNNGNGGNGNGGNGSHAPDVQNNPLTDSDTPDETCDDIESYGDFE